MLLVPSATVALLTRCLIRYHPHLTRSLAKWSAKVAAVAPSALLPASRRKFSQAGIGGVRSVGAQIEEVLQSDWPALVSRTRLKRSKGDRVTIKHGAAEDEEVEDVEVFDDTDFYQQLLRDVIDAKGESAGRVDWMAGQRQKKSKKHVDTKASKGRKLRFALFFKSYDRTMFLTGTPQIRSPRKDAEFHGPCSSHSGGVARGAD